MGNIELLASFLKFLNEKSLIDFRVIKDDDDLGFNNRLKAQKYVYIGQEKFDLDLGYHFSRYKFGPYSSTLTEDYYDINIYTIDDPEYGIYEYVAEMSNNDSFGIVSLPNTFDEKKFLEVVSNKTESWLEIATTIINISKSYSDPKIILDMVNRVKSSYESKYIEQVFNDLKSYGLLDCQ